MKTFGVIMLLAFASVANGQYLFPADDTDNDGVPDIIDNCVYVPNPDQEPSVNPFVGAACLYSSIPTNAACKVVYEVQHTSVGAIEKVFGCINFLPEPSFVPSWEAEPNEVSDRFANLRDTCVLVPNADQGLYPGVAGPQCSPDLNNDGVLDRRDLRIFNRTLIHTSGPAGDFNGDYKVNAKDRRILKQYIETGIPYGPSCVFSTAEGGAVGVITCRGFVGVEGID